jgi:hypothetical protein
MNEHDIRLVRSDCFKAQAHRNLPRDAAHDRRTGVNTRRARVEQVPIIGMHDGLYERYSVVLAQGGKALPQRRPAGQGAVLFGDIAAGPQPAAGRHHHCCDGCRHLCVACSYNLRNHKDALQSFVACSPDAT